MELLKCSSHNFDSSYHLGCLGQWPYSRALFKSINLVFENEVLGYNGGIILNNSSII